MKGFRVVKESSNANQYCGPAALSIITGRPVEEICRLLRMQVTGQRAIRGLHSHHLTTALGLLGYVADFRFVRNNTIENFPTLAAWLRRPREPGKVYLVGITGHWLVVRGRKIADNRNPEGVFLRKYKNRRARVRKAWIIKRRGDRKSPRMSI